MQQKSVHLVRAGNIAPSVKEQSHGTEDESEISFRYESTMKWLRMLEPGINRQPGPENKGHKSVVIMGPPPENKSRFTDRKKTPITQATTKRLSAIGDFLVWSLILTWKKF